jgi:hypothetical protein
MSDVDGDLDALDGMLAEFDDEPAPKPSTGNATRGRGAPPRGGGGGGRRGGGGGGGRGRGGTLRRGKRVESVVLDVAFMSEAEAIREEVCRRCWFVSDIIVITCVLFRRRKFDDCWKKFNDSKLKKKQNVNDLNKVC